MEEDVGLKPLLVAIAVGLFDQALDGVIQTFHGSVVFMEQAKGVKQFFLKTFLADQKLSFVDQKHIRLKVLLAESGKLPILDRGHKFTGELFCGQVGHLCIWVALVYVVADGVEQMGFAQADAAMNEQRIMGFAGIVGGG